MDASGRTPLSVRALSREDVQLLATGKLLLVNNQIDTTTGTVQLKATFANANHALWPGQYVNVQLVLGERHSAVTVPASVVQRGPDGLFAYIVNPDASVALQPIRVAAIQDGKAVIEEGLSGGTRVVVDGQYKLKPGIRVADTRPARIAADSTTGSPSPAAPRNGGTQ
jgi:multidrug efflux system membrane fusion protein